MIAEALSQLGVNRAVIVAHSFAATVGTALALDDPARVAGIVLVAPALYPWPTGVAWYYTLAATPLVGPLFVWTVALPAGPGRLYVQEHGYSVEDAARRSPGVSR